MKILTPQERAAVDSVFKPIERSREARARAQAAINAPTAAQAVARAKNRLRARKALRVARAIIGGQ